MIIWGGIADNTPYDDGAAYNPTTNKWEELPVAPISSRWNHTAIWTGERMIIWGGLGNTGTIYYDDGASYDPNTNKWEELPEAPLALRRFHTAVWTGQRMIIWGSDLVNDGISYNPATKIWNELTDAPISTRSYHTATWTGDRMVIWGGAGGGRYFADGASYETPFKRR
jgi:N-acetylneuraminic acid mutarotase